MTSEPLVERRTVLARICSTLVVPGGCSFGRRTGHPMTPQQHLDEQMFRVALAIDEYRGDHGGKLPPSIVYGGSVAMHSWRVLLLPHLGYGALFAKYNLREAWDGPNNRRLHDVVIDEYATQMLGAVPRTAFLAVTGKRTVWSCTPEELQLLWETGMGAAVLIEMLDRNVHWLEPRDFLTDGMARGADPLFPYHWRGTRKDFRSAIRLRSIDHRDTYSIWEDESPDSAWCELTLPPRMRPVAEVDRGQT